MANKVVKYFIEAKEELQKVTWPTRKETTRYSIIVIVATVLLALYFGVVDFGLQRGLEGLINLSGATTVSAPANQPINLEGIDLEALTENGDAVIVEDSEVTEGETTDGTEEVTEDESASNDSEESTEE